MVLDGQKVRMDRQRQPYTSSGDKNYLIYSTFNTIVKMSVAK